MAFFTNFQVIINILYFLLENIFTDITKNQHFVFYSLFEISSICYVNMNPFTSLS